MMEKLKSSMYGFSVKFKLWGDILLVVFFIIIWKYSPYLWENALLGGSKGFILLLVGIHLLTVTALIIWLYFIMWHYWVFRYLLYFLSWCLSKIRRLLFSWWFKLPFFVFLAIVLQLIRYHLLGKPFSPKDFLYFKEIVSTFLLTLFFLLLYQLYKARNRMVISDFNDHTGKDEFKPIVQSIAPRIVNEISRLTGLFRTIDDSRYRPGKNLIDARVRIRDIGSELADMVGPNSQVQVGSFLTVPVGALLRVMAGFVRGPIIRGSLKGDGESMLLTARLEGGGRSGSWQVKSSDIENFSSLSHTDKVSRMTCQLVSRIITDLVNVGSPRWKAVHLFTEGLRKYRDTLRSDNDKRLKLQEAKRAFKEALVEDNKFAQCYYNLGIIYRDLDNEKSSEASFRKALSEKADDYKSYYELARIYYSGGKYNDARWCCKQASALFPRQPDHWILLGVINYFDWKNKESIQDSYDNELEVPSSIIHYFEVAVMLSWRIFCCGILRGKTVDKISWHAAISLRNLAVVRGQKYIRPWGIRNCGRLFKQVLFLLPGDSDLALEMGKYYYRRKKWEKAYKAFFRVFEDDKYVDEPMRFWACYAMTNGQLLKKADKEGKQNNYRRKLTECLTHFLDSASKLIHIAPARRGHAKESDTFKKNIDLILKALILGGAEEGYFQWLTNLPAIKDNLTEEVNDTALKSWLKDDGAMPVAIPEGAKDWEWAKAQRSIILAKLILGQDKHKKKYAKKAVELLTISLSKLENSKEPLTYHREVKHLTLHLLLAEAYYYKKNLPAALENSRQAVRLNPFGLRERVLLGNIYMALEDFQQAIRIFESTFRIDPNNPEVLKQIGDAYLACGLALRNPEKRKQDFEAGINFFLQSLRIMERHSFEESPQQDYLHNLGEIHYYLGRFYRELSEDDKSLNHYQVAHKMGYRTLESLIQMGWGYINIKSFNKAAQTFKNAEEQFKQMQGNKRDKLVRILFGHVASRIEREVAIDERGELYKEINEEISQIDNEVQQISKVDPFVKTKNTKS